MTRQQFLEISKPLLSKVSWIKEGDYAGALKVVSEFQSLIIQHKEHVNTLVLDAIPEIQKQFQKKQWKEGKENLMQAVHEIISTNTYRDSGNKFG